jgi:hypothetical protein
VSGVRVPPPLFASEHDRNRPEASKPDRIRDLRREARREESPQVPESSRQEPAQGDLNRPLRAITGATVPRQPPITAGTDPDLALVLDRWADLPAAVRAGIVAMVKAVSSKGGG